MNTKENDDGVKVFRNIVLIGALLSQLMIWPAIALRHEGYTDVAETLFSVGLFIVILLFLLSFLAWIVHDDD